MCYAGGPYCYEVAKKRYLAAEETLAKNPDSPELKEECLQLKLEYFGTRQGQYELKQKIADNPQLEELKEKARLLRREQVKAAQAQNVPVNKHKEEVQGPHVYKFPSHKLLTAKKAIQKANNKLEKNGIEERFSYTVEKYYVSGPNPFIPTREEFVKLTLTTPKIAFGGHEFLAVINEEGEGLVTRTRPGEELGGWKPESMECDHCRQIRSRSKSYLVRDPQGNVLQIGSACVEPYLGIKPQGLWALEYDGIEKSTDDLEGDTGRRASQHFPVNDTLAYAMALTENGETFISKKRAEETGETPTSEEFNNLMNNPNQRGRTWANKIMRKAQEYKDSGEVDALRAHIKELDGSSDYIANLQAVDKNEWVSPKSTALLISAVSLNKRKRLKDAQNAYKPGYAGEVGSSLKGRKAKVMSNIVRDGSNYNASRSQVTFVDEDGHQMVWWASKEIEVNEGDEVLISSGRVKRHGQYNGIDQTILTRIRLQPSE